jgi:thiamine-monophosphate kinase
VDEFSLIKRYFDVQPSSANVVLGIGDDTAILDQQTGQQLLVTTDTLVAGVHFPVDSSPESIGYKALSVNLSDIAAMGGRPAWYTLALTLPEADDCWLRGFSAALHALARRYDISLIGGDTTRGPLAISITMLGTVPTGEAVTRSGAEVGDSVFVTDTMGDAALALYCMQNEIDLDPAVMTQLRTSLDRPVARVEEGLCLRDYASAMIDISDGLAADLGHVLASSGVAAELEASRLPLSQAVRHAAAEAQMNDDTLLQLVTTGGDDYELCAVVPQTGVPGLQSTWPPALAPLTQIGTIRQGTGMILRSASGSHIELAANGYRHFT